MQKSENSCVKGVSTGE